MALITFTSDFGTGDYYVGAVKGVILRTAPNATIVDLSHDIGPQDVFAAAFLLRHAAAEFPADTIHLAVVDPGVGTTRLPLIVSGHGSFWVGPDNGLLSYALEDPQSAAFEIVADPRVSATFHGRDVFAPAAAQLATGRRPDEFGPPVADPHRLPLVAARQLDGCVEGAVIHVDHFGNLVTSISRKDLEVFGASGVSVHLGDHTVTGLSRTYADGGEGGVLALIGSSGLLEIAVNDGSAASALGGNRGDAVSVRRA